MHHEEAKKERARGSSCSVHTLSAAVHGIWDVAMASAVHKVACEAPNCHPSPCFKIACKMHHGIEDLLELPHIWELKEAKVQDFLLVAEMSQDIYCTAVSSRADPCFWKP